ncbi:hypothetical protein K490DRAFT_65566 [Saccharata proteae CBS 121410]|uniref:Malate dehydrogenase n=1 Tax=Saccharata proteae CBS 121410 TaxID=1314787 RepID=A0A9P4HX94_9PEZI|nr:hypothetical protein K490DRAFT_65566 [Saccharata proteae CBS 121410]
MATPNRALAFLLFAASIAASPLGHPSPKHSSGAPDLSSLVLPSSSLPAPTGLKLKHVALGIGTQNYTCSADASSVSPSTFGALASLYDIGPFLVTPLGKLFSNSLPALALGMYGALSAIEQSSAWNQIVSQMPMSTDVLQTETFGHHFFADVDTTLTPTWDLTPSTQMYPSDAPNIFFQGKKNATMAAPTEACKGLQGEGAVDWLYLTKATSSDDEITAIYRVITAGGMQPDTCENVNGEDIEVKYAAEYWFYGPGSC